MFPSCSPFLSKAKQNLFCGWHSPVHFWQHRCQTPGISEACKANTQCSNSLRHWCGWLCREAQGWSQRIESHFLQCQLWHHSLYHYKATVVQNNFGERKGSDAPFGTQRWNRLFLIPLSNKEDGGSWVAEERQSCQGEKSHAGGNIPEKGVRRRQEQLLVSRWWTSAAQRPAARTSSGWKARGKEVQGVPSEAPYSTGLPTGSVHSSKPKTEVPSQPRSPLLRWGRRGHLYQHRCAGVPHGQWTSTHGPGQLPQQSWTYS